MFIKTTRSLKMTAILSFIILTVACSAKGSGLVQDIKEYRWEQSCYKVFELMEKGEYDEARIKAEKSLNMAVKIFGDIHKNTAASQRNLAKVFVLQKEYEKAEALFNKAINLENRSYAPTIVDLADLYKMQMKNDMALEYYNEALILLDKSKGRFEKVFLPSLLKKIYSVNIDLGRYDNAQLIKDRLQDIGESVE